MFKKRLLVAILATLISIGAGVGPAMSAGANEAPPPLDNSQDETSNQGDSTDPSEGSEAPFVRTYTEEEYQELRDNNQEFSQENNQLQSELATTRFFMIAAIIVLAIMLILVLVHYVRLHWSGY